MGGLNAVIAAGGGAKEVFLVVAADVIPKLDLGAVCGARSADIHASTALHSDDAVLAAAARSHCPLLVGAVVISPLNELCSVGGGCAAGVERLGAVAGDEFIGSIGDNSGGTGRRGA